MVILPAQIKAGTVFISTSFNFLLFSCLRDRLQNLGFCECQAIVGLIPPRFSYMGIGHPQGLKHPNAGGIIVCLGDCMMGSLTLGQQEPALWSCTPALWSCTHGLQCCGGTFCFLALGEPSKEPNPQEVWALRAADTLQELRACYSNRFCIIPVSQASPCNIKNAG